MELEVQVVLESKVLMCQITHEHRQMVVHQTSHSPLQIEKAFVLLVYNIFLLFSQYQFFKRYSIDIAIHTDVGFPLS